MTFVQQNQTNGTDRHFFAFGSFLHEYIALARIVQICMQKVGYVLSSKYLYPFNTGIVLSCHLPFDLCTIVWSLPILSVPI